MPQAAQVRGADIRAFLLAFREKLAAQEAHLTALDAAIGDADHGSGMLRGANAVVAALPADGSPGALLKSAAMSFISKTGGASGPLYGTALLRAAAALPDQPQVTRPELQSALHAAYAGLVERGKAAPGDKTMLDAWKPALDALDAGKTWREAAGAAAQGAEATLPLVARKGRASYLGERSVGHLDPGAASSALLWAALADTLSGPLGEGPGPA
ncbi:dihydroxyacetone kinase subunit L [Deinococcus cavernae]|uniref:Dihydroxyacetone kinase subunit L n=2 Tax=Deinococcus cavernae TaxID=2320857 RepID=A0A418VC77_9DEIO|nr:dihydroxyacetone kinase subunit L [Deinococcus cavernae]